MKQKNRLKFTDSKIFWMVVSLLISLVLWAYVTQLDNSTITRSFTEVPVQFVGEDELESIGLAVANIDTKEVAVTLRGNRRVMGRLDSSKITAVIDVSNISRTGEMKWSYYLKYTGIGNENNSITVVSRTPEAIGFTVSELKSKTVDIVGEFGGTTAYGYYVKDSSADPSSISISGSSYLLQNISGVKAIVYGSQLTDTFTESVMIDSDQFVVLDTNGEPMDKSGLTFSVDKIDVSVSISDHKFVPLTISLETGDGMSQDNCSVTITPSKVEVSGEASVLQDLEYIDLGVFSLDGVGESYEQSYDIVYPEGVTSVDNITKASVKVEVHGLEAREYTITEIACDKVPDGMIAEAVGELNILLRGPSDSLENVTADNLHAVADMSNVTSEEGNVTVPVSITCDVDEIGVVGNYEITVNLKYK